MRVSTLAMCGLALVLCGCGKPAEPIADVPAPVVPVVVVPAAPPKVPIVPPEAVDWDANGFELDPARSLKTAVVRIGSIECGNEYGDRDCRECQAVIDAATPDELMTAYIAAVKDPNVRSWPVASIASYAERLPFSENLRNALRTRRDFLREGHGSIFRYFVQHGDESDLEWMDDAAEKMAGKPEWAYAEVRKLRARLIRQRDEAAK